MYTDGGWLSLGRDQKENDLVAALKLPGDILLKMPIIPGSTRTAAILRPPGRYSTRSFTGGSLWQKGEKWPSRGRGCNNKRPGRVFACN